MIETLQTSFTQTMQTLESNVYWLVFGYLLLSEFGTPIPLPGVMVLVAGGFLVGRSDQLPLLIIAGGILATLPGATVLYWLGRRGGEPLLRRIGPRLGLTEARREQVVRWLESRAVLGFVVLRLLPILRVSTSLIPGAIGMPWQRYMLGMYTGIVAWVTVYVGAGYGLARWGSVGLAVIPAILLIGAGIIAWRWRRSPKEFS